MDSSSGAALTNDYKLASKNQNVRKKNFYLKQRYLRNRVPETPKLVKDNYNNKEKDENKNRYDTKKTLEGDTFIMINVRMGRANQCTRP